MTTGQLITTQKEKNDGDNKYIIKLIGDFEKKFHTEFRTMLNQTTQSRPDNLKFNALKKDNYADRIEIMFDCVIPKEDQDSPFSELEKEDLIRFELDRYGFRFNPIMRSRRKNWIDLKYRIYRGFEESKHINIRFDININHLVNKLCRTAKGKNLKGIKNYFEDKKCYQILPLINQITNQVINLVEFHTWHAINCITNRTSNLFPIYFTTPKYSRFELASHFSKSSGSRFEFVKITKHILCRWPGCDISISGVDGVKGIRIRHSKGLETSVYPKEPTIGRIETRFFKGHIEKTPEDILGYSLAKQMEYFVQKTNEIHSSIYAGSKGCHISPALVLEEIYHNSKSPSSARDIIERTIQGNGVAIVGSSGSEKKLWTSMRSLVKRRIYEKKGQKEYQLSEKYISLNISNNTTEYFKQFFKEWTQFNTSDIERSNLKGGTHE